MYLHNGGYNEATSEKSAQVETLNRDCLYDGDFNLGFLGIHVLHFALSSCA